MIDRSQKFIGKARSVLSKAVIYSLAFLSISLSVAGAAKSQTENGVQTEIRPLAKQYLSENKLPEAKNLLQTWLALDPSSAEAHFLLGKAFLFGKNYADACRELRAACQLASLSKADSDLAKRANNLIGELPQRFREPSARGSLARISPDNSLATPSPIRLRQPARVLVFEAPWQPGSQTSENLAVNIRTAVTEANCNCKIDRYSLDDLDKQGVFDLFYVSQIPSVVAIDRQNKFVGALCGEISDDQISKLVRAANTR
jgi:thioredoxin-like negative regulator of GroEL